MTHSETPYPVAVAGASGRMGLMLVAAVEAAADMHLSGRLDLGLDSRTALHAARYLIDFTRPEGTMAHLALCQELGIKLVIGTTGFSDEQKHAIAVAAQRIAIVMAPNMSVGVNVTLKLLEMAAQVLHHQYDIEIVEAHHKHKVDAPSGTALQMGEVMARSMGVQLPEVAVYSRHGHTGARQQGSIGFATVRGGDLVGEHTVLFCGEGERIEISHKATSRASYAQGSLMAVRFLATRSHGLFDMHDVLALSPAPGAQE